MFILSPLNTNIRIKILYTSVYPWFEGDKIANHGIFYFPTTYASNRLNGIEFLIVHTLSTVLQH